MNKQLLNSLYRIRMSCPQVVQQLWDAVKVIRYQRQIPNLERIAKYMQRVHAVSEEEVVRQLGYCVRDSLLHIIKRKGSKGSKVGVEQEGYKLPEQFTAEKDNHDWYCSECHTGGDVLLCGACHRVYHIACINGLSGTKIKPVNQKFQCSVCQTSEEDTPLPNVKQSQLNKLLTMVCIILKERYGQLANSSKFLQRSIKIGSPGAQIDIGSESWRISYLIHQVVDIQRMMTKAKQGAYTNLSQFTADAQTIVHNVVIFHGVHSHLADSARMMARDCMSEISQVRWCHTCYQSAGISRRKFTAPCRPPHELVYAKAKGAPYWPAKVLREQGDKLDVRFFGGPHYKATVDRSNVMPITTNVNSLQDMKRNSSWNRACEELKRHQELLRRLEEGTYESSSASDSDDSITSEKSVKSFKSEKSTISDKLKIEKEKPEKKVDKPAKVEKEKQVKPPKVNKSAKKRESVKKRITSSDEDEDNFSVQLDFDDLDMADDDSSFMEEPKKKKQSTEGVKKKRGRPPNPNKTPPPKRKRGRPPKKSLEETQKKEEKHEDDADKSDDEKDMSVLSKEDREVEDKEMKDESDRNISNSPIEGMEDDSNEEKPKIDSIDRPSSPRPNSSLNKSPLSVEPEKNLFSQSFRLDKLKTEPQDGKNEEEIVSSSCMEPQVRCFGTQTKHDSKKDRANKELIAKLREELEEMKNAHTEEIKQLKERHSQEMAACKKKQWCYNCEQEAIYHCCWNTAYCSTDCQQLHWQREHKRVCRRKR